jgi:O-antigen/teichoic acid export membrane protein
MIRKELSFLLKHCSIYSLGNFIGQAVSFLLLPLYTRYLTPSDYGVLSLVNITTDIIGIVIGLGIVDSVIRFYHDYDTEEGRNLVISNSYWISIIIAVVSIPILLFGTSPLSYLVFHSDKYSEMFIVSVTSMLIGINSNISFTFLRIKAQSLTYIKLNILNMVLSIGLNIYFIVYLKTGVIGILYSALISKVIFSLLIGIPIIAQVGIRFSRKLTSEMLAFSFPLIFSSVFRVIINESDKYFINYFFSPFQTGIYSICQKIGTSVHALVISPFLQAYLPRRFEIMKNADADKTFASILDCFFVVICFIGLALSVLSNCIVHLMTTEKFYPAAQYIPLSVLSMVIFSLKYHFEIGIMVEKKTKYIAYINGISSVINIALNFLLISRFGLWGALISLNICYGVTSLLNYIVSQRMYYIKYNIINLMSIILFAIALFATSIAIGVNSMLWGVAFNILLLILYLAGMYYLYLNRFTALDINGLISKFRGL